MGRTLVPRGSVVKCLTRNPGYGVRTAQDPLSFFVGVSLGARLENSRLWVRFPGWSA